MANAVKKAGAGGANATVSQEMMDKANKVVGSRWNFSKDALGNPMFWVSTIVSAALATAAAFTIYAQNTGWGADPPIDAFAVASAVVAAAGFRSLIVTTAGK
jgi:hypothetical protein